MVDRLVFIATRIRAGRPRSRASIPVKGRDFLFSITSRHQTGSGAHPAFRTMAIGGVSPDHSPPSIAKVKNDGAIAPLPHSSS
jgi:hypothetical protein